MGLFSKKTPQKEEKAETKTTQQTTSSHQKSIVSKTRDKAEAKTTQQTTAAAMQVMANGDYLPIPGKVINDTSFTATFTAEPSKGNRLNIAAENYSDTLVTLTIKANGRIVQNIQLAKGKSTVYKATITQKTDYEVQLVGANKAKFSTFIKARLFKE